MKKTMVLGIFSLSALLLSACKAEQNNVAVNADKPIETVELSTSALAGKSLYLSKGCIGCHGPEGKSRNPKTYPVLAGKSADYIVEQLTAFKTYKRRNPMMSSVAVNLQEEDMTQLAAYLSAMTY